MPPLTEQAHVILRRAIRAGDTAIDVIVAQGNLADFAPAVGYADGGEGGAVFTDRYAHATPVIQDM